jgi:hypothetical protein
LADIIVAGITYSNIMLTVGLVTNSPVVVTPGINNAAVCGNGTVVASAGQTVFVSCVNIMPPFRYVVVFGWSNRLEICELEVYGKGKSMTSTEY